MKTVIFAVGLFLVSALPVLAGPKAPDQHGTQFYALSALSQSATPQQLGDKELPKVDQGNSGVMPVELTNAELNAVTGGNRGFHGAGIGKGGGNGCFCGNGAFTDSRNGRF